MNTVYTVAIGQRYTGTLWAKDCLRAWEQYCDRHNLNLHVQTTATFPFSERSTRLHYEKFNFIDQNFDGSILIVDLDTGPVPDMPNLFSIYSDRNLTCRVNPEWGPGHRFYVYSQPGKFRERFAAMSWPVFGDLNKGTGPWPKPDVWFYVIGGMMLLPLAVQQLFKEHATRIKQESPPSNLIGDLLDEGLWAWWIARFNKEYDMGVDAFESWRWTPYPSNRLCVGEAESLLPDCSVVHLAAGGFPNKKYLSYYYTEWYILRSRKKTLAGLVRWAIRYCLSCVGFRV